MLAYDFPEEYARPVASYRTRDRSIKEWRGFFMQSPQTDKHQYTRFPLLEILTLDFSEWNLGPQEDIFVS